MSSEQIREYYPNEYWEISWICSSIAESRYCCMNPGYLRAR